MSSSQEAQGRWLWLWNRLRCMGPAEIAYRARSLVRARVRRQLGLDRPAAPPPQSQQDGTRWIALPSPDHLAEGVAPYLAEADAIAAGSVRLFERERYALGCDPDWLRCPLTGVQAPAWPSHRIAITDRAQVGDIKYLWELNRHLHWVPLAQAWALQPQPDRLALLGAQLRRWLRQNPIGMGPNWTSSLELAIRLLNWSVVWQLIGGRLSPLFQGEDGEALRAEWLASIWQHAKAIQAGYSRHSSANNHLVGELCGVYVAARTWPCWADLRQAGERAKVELIRQSQLQIHADGVPAEQAFEYAGFIHDFFLVAARCAEADGAPMPASYLQRLQALAVFAQAMLDREGQAPMVGDADGAEALRLDPRTGREALRALLEKQAALQGGELPPRAWARQRRDDVLWLGLRPVATAEREPEPTWSFTEGGYQLFGTARGQAQEVLGGIDVGPLGYLGIAAHGHADALQLWLSLGGQPLLIDPGTFAYWADKRWRDYFRGTSAHNTLQVDGRDQSASGGRFMWTRHARTQLLALQRVEPGGLRLRASHDGYGSARHERELDYRAGQPGLRVTDRFAAGRVHGLALHWHLAPGWDCDLSGDLLTLRRGAWTVRLRVEASSPGCLELIEGQQEPTPLGWYSSAYGHKQPSPTLRWSGRGHSLQWQTTIEWSYQA